MMNKQLISFVVLILLLAGCSSNKNTDPNSNPITPSITTTSVSSGNVEIPTTNVNVYHVMTQKTCDAVIQYLTSVESLKYLSQLGVDSKFECSPNGKFGLWINLGENYSSISIQQHDNNQYSYSFYLRNVYEITYRKNDETKNADLTIYSQFGLMRDKSFYHDIMMSLSAGDTYYTMDYDQTNNNLISKNPKTYNNELIFVDDLHQQIIQKYKEATQKMMTQETGIKVANQIINIINDTSELS